MELSGQGGSLCFITHHWWWCAAPKHLSCAGTAGTCQESHCPWDYWLLDNYCLFVAQISLAAVTPMGILLWALLWDGGGTVLRTLAQKSRINSSGRLVHAGRGSPEGDSLFWNLFQAVWSCVCLTIPFQPWDNSSFKLIQELHLTQGRWPGSFLAW